MPSVTVTVIVGPRTTNMRPTETGTRTVFIGGAIIGTVFHERPCESWHLRLSTDGKVNEDSPVLCLNAHTTSELETSIAATIAAICSAVIGKTVVGVLLP